MNNKKKTWRKTAIVGWTLVCLIVGFTAATERPWFFFPVGEKCEPIGGKYQHGKGDERSGTGPFTFRPQ
jgi:hypothetical protein